MNTTIKKAWIAALRSGRYKQGRGFLKNPDGARCCLGVLCAVRHVGVDRVKRWGDEYLSYTFLKRVGLTPEQEKDLATLNDEWSKGGHINPFPIIADYIQKNL